METITATRDGWTAKYSGGCYIDLYVLGHCVEVINILDYATGEYRMEPTQKALAPRTARVAERERRQSWRVHRARPLPVTTTPRPTSGRGRPATERETRK